MDRREELLNGVCQFPKQLFKLLNVKEGGVLENLINEFWDHCWYQFLIEKPIDTLTWYTKFNNQNFFNLLLMHLSKSGWISSVIENNYAYITLNQSKLEKWLMPDEIANIKFKKKFKKYELYETKSVLNNLVQINGTHKVTGLIRKGFMKAGNNLFCYDTMYIKRYAKGIANNILKGMSASTKEITYHEIVNELIDYYSIIDQKYTLGYNISDSRGRSIFHCTSKVFNPISHKDARACLKLDKPIELNYSGFKAIYAFIAELLGYRGISYQDKVRKGESYYILRMYPESYDEMIEKNDFSNLHILIWLERIYENLDHYSTTKWYVPIEIDAMASVLQFVGLLTNDHEFLRKTNIIGNAIEDAWSRPYCSRLHIKKALTPILYGSSRHPIELWVANKLDYTQEMINSISNDLLFGIYRNAREFKDFIIENVKPKEIEHIKIWKDKFDVECNRFKWEETVHKEYFIYSSSTSSLKKITRELNLVPDLEQFKRYHVTLLIHNLDSQVANTICENIDWVLPNHDAFVCNPNDAMKIKELYRETIYEIYSHRKEILRQYFDSIGINLEYEEHFKEEIPYECFRLDCLK